MTAPSWDLSIAYADLNDVRIEQDIELIEQCIKLLNTQASQREVVSVMQNAIVTREAAGRLLSTVYTFANCYTSVDVTHPQAKALVGRMAKLSSEMEQAFSPYQLALMHADDDFIADVLESNNPDVAGQVFSIAQLRKLADQSLSVSEEQLLSAMQVDGRDGWGRLYDNLTGTLKISLDTEDGKQETLGFSQAASLLYGAEFSRQEPAWRGIQNAMSTHRETFAAILNALSGWRLTEYQKRSHQRKIHFLEPSLYESRIEAQTLETMISVAKESRSVGQKAGKLMARVHGLEAMKPWNHLAAMPAFDGEAKVYGFDEAIEVIRNAFAQVNPEMASFVDLMVENGWIDAAPSENKRLGAYCTKLAATRTPLVFMTWSGSRSDLLTLAHELGHAFHNWVMKDMPLCQTRYPMTLAETASIFAENIVQDYLIAQAATAEEKLEMLWEELSSAYALTINIPVRYEFEKAFYERRASGELSADDICQLMSETWQSWYGDSMSESDPYFWASKLHFSISEISFYNYPYLFGYLFSKGIYAQRAAKGESFYRDYVALLRDTGAMMAEDVVAQHLQMDLTQADFWQQSIERIREKVDEFEQLLVQIGK
ncbi:M3 family oligoendopeptidase [Vibrio vulnificus]|uniref:M3 family oligoendopeptidase n=1 Tax=Vibrio vulnificus TaxID=672 RepID=UPI001DA6ABF3|nr:M3 family oligoendopeptidase [Vibrio vulnificus]EGQ9293485.1 M3 family oligoendopeptidase [Vibrio vulnificus]EJT1338389.1 M3 family oligoendopeptidase [Vibrio vulnificus]ELV8743737.1 M3 family oligoendopeptidase [Vibrio vulnificus]ELV8751766.1 M3 family oligoendopeptidase [Vibrio vulnificus]MDS1827311.1 M3 family oligoendopeptidase [Vibrio vulnificus]